MALALLKSYWSSGNLIFEKIGTLGTTGIDLGVDGTGIDVKFYGDTASSFMLWDQSADQLVFDAADIQLGDNDILKFGDATGGDVNLTWNASSLVIVPATDNTGAINFGNGTTDIDVKMVLGAATDFVLFDVSDGQVTFDSAELNMGDSDEIEFGDAADVTMAWDGTDFDVLAAADDSVFKFGTGTNSFDIWMYGNIASDYVLWDASASILSLEGSSRLSKMNTISPRFELKWVAGQRGKPSLNGDIQNAAEGTRMIADPDFEVLGVNASSDDTTFYAEGGILLQTDGADGDEVIILPHLDGNQSAWAQVTWGTDKQVIWEAHIKTGASITDNIIWAGLKLTNTEVTATDNDQVFFRYEDGVNAGEWQAISSIANSDDAHDTNVVVAINTEYHLKIAIASDRTAKFYINGVLVETSAALTNATDLIPYIGVATDGVAAGAKDLYVFGQSISRVVG